MCYLWHFIVHYASISTSFCSITSGITLEHGKTYSQIVERPFHISMAALGVSYLESGPTTVMIESEKANYALCTLQSSKIPQQPLNLNFTEGEEVKFFLDGNGGDVHLTGR